MKMIDPHIHIDSRSREDLSLMAAAGVTAVVSMSYYPHLNLPITSGTLIDFYERAIRFETWRGKQELIDVYLGIALNPVSIPPEYEKVLEALPRYLSDERVVAIGEIGLEPGSQTCPDLERQKEIVRAQLKIAGETGKPVLFHTPHLDKQKWVEQYLELIAGEKLAPGRVVIDHCDATVVKMVTDAGCVAGITVQPWRGLKPQDAANILKDCELDSVLFDSDCNITLPSDAMSVPRTAVEMKKLGFSEEQVNRVTFRNPVRIFNLPL